MIWYEIILNVYEDVMSLVQILTAAGYVVRFEKYTDYPYSYRVLYCKKPSEELVYK